MSLATRLSDFADRHDNSENAPARSLGRKPFERPTLEAWRCTTPGHWIFGPEFQFWVDREWNRKTEFSEHVGRWILAFHFGPFSFGLIRKWVTA